MPRNIVRTAAAALVAALSVGCATDTKMPVVPAEGKLHFADGKPLPKGTRVVFNPAEGGSGTASGVTDETGAFKLKHANGSAGAEVGKYSVQVLAPEGDSGEFYKQLPKDFADGAALAAEVKEGMAPLDLVVKVK